MFGQRASWFALTSRKGDRTESASPCRELWKEKNSLPSTCMMASAQMAFWRHPLRKGDVLPRLCAACLRFDQRLDQRRPKNDFDRALQRSDSLTNLENQRCRGQRDETPFCRKRIRAITARYCAANSVGFYMLKGSRVCKLLLRFDSRQRIRDPHPRTNATGSRSTSRCARWTILGSVLHADVRGEIDATPGASRLHGKRTPGQIPACLSCSQEYVSRLPMT